jgi:hypothetical protein
MPVWGRPLNDSASALVSDLPYIKYALLAQVIALKKSVAAHPPTSPPGMIVFARVLPIETSSPRLWV